MNSARWQQKLGKFRALSAAEKLTLVHAALWLAAARLMLLFLPFRWFVKRLSGENDAVSRDPDPVLLERIGRAVRTAACNVPWRSDCFPQSIAGWMLLKHNGYASTVHLGVERVGDNELAGHAWLTCGDIVVTGGEALDRYVETHRLGA